MSRGNPGTVKRDERRITAVISGVAAAKLIGQWRSRVRRSMARLVLQPGQCTPSHVPAISAARIVGTTAYPGQGRADRSSAG